MASIARDPNGRKRISFTSPDGDRVAIRLGKATLREAEHFKIRVEHLLSSNSLAGGDMDVGVAQWLEKLPPKLHGKLVAFGLCAPREARPETALGPFIQQYMESRVDLKQRTKWMLQQAQRSLVSYFGADKALGDINEADAELWRLSMVKQGLADATIRKRCQHSKQFLARALKQKLVESNPFIALPSSSKPNPSRMVFISQADISKVIEACPCVEWKTIFALARYGGLRCPSEILALQWCDIFWDQNRMLVRSEKTERHVGGESRLVPIFGELRPYLLEAFEEAKPGEPYVITRYRTQSANLRTQAHRIIKRAGLKPWTRTFQNLRSSRETELTEKFPLHVVTQWIGNSALIAQKHYLQVTDAHFEKAAWKAACPTAETPCEPLQTLPVHRENNSVFQCVTGNFSTSQQFPIAPRGFEPLLPG